jgi:hypothetical protein
LRLARLGSDDWLDDEDALTVHEKTLLAARLATYAKDPDAGSTWEKLRAVSAPALVASRKDGAATNYEARGGVDITDDVWCIDNRSPGGTNKLKASE